jgi:transcription-repair coupling factor (superfamily II helicase)
LLGPRQSGHITAIGFSLYTRLLADAVEEYKALMAGAPKPPPKLPAPTIDLPLDAFIPEDYVPDVETRLELYKTLGNVATAEHLDDILREYTDRFGMPPPEVDNLFYALRIKALAAKAGVESISTEEGNIVLRRFQGLPFYTLKLTPALRDEIYIGRTQIRLNYKRLKGEWQKVLEGVIKGMLT